MSGILAPEALFRDVVLGAVFLLLAFPIHEFAHAWVANRLGDSTARYMGRLTLDPVAHFDPMGGGLLLLSLVASGGTFAVGMAKPTPVNPSNLRGGRRGEMWVALAGPVSNLILAVAGAVVVRLIALVPALTNVVISNQAGELGFRALETFVVINIVLFLFNLIPIPPLDGWTVLAGLVSPKVAWDMARARAQIGLYGMLIVFAIFFLGGATILRPIIGGLFGLLTGLPY